MNLKLGHRFSTRRYCPPDAAILLVCDLLAQLLSVLALALPSSSSMDFEVEFLRRCSPHLRAHYPYRYSDFGRRPLHM
jgi:hypothetical protein